MLTRFTAAARYAPAALFASVALAALSAVPALAEDAPDHIVVTGERRTQAAAEQVRQTPGGVDVVGAEQFEDRLAVSLRDALSLSPGVYTQPRFGQEVRIAIRGSGLSRGFHQRGLTLLQDGVPINLADNNGDFQELDPQVFERIEVYRGSNALRFGSSTLGGAINAVTPTGRTAPGLEARIDGGSFDTLRTKAAFGTAGPVADAWFALTADTSSGDRDHADRHSLRFNGNVGLALAPDATTRFYATVSHIRQELPGSLTLANALTDPRQALPGNIAGDQARDVDSIRLQNRTTWDLGPARLEGGIFLNAKQLYHPIFQVIDQNSTDWGVFARAEADLGPATLTLGSTARFGEVAARQYLNIAGKRGNLTADQSQTANTIDTYGEARISPLSGLELIAGAVWTTGFRDADNRLAPQRSGRAEFSQLSPKLGLLYETGGLQFYANTSRSAELPGFSELAQTPFATGGITRPGFVALDPQRAWSTEAGVRGRLGPVRLDLTAYRSDLTGELLQFDQAPGVPAATFNAGRTRHQGIEAALDIAVAPWLLLRQAYTYSDFRFRGDAQFGDNRLPVIPEHLYRAELRLGTEALAVTPRVEWVPEGAWADYANTLRVSGYALIGAQAEASLAQHWTLFLDARNLTGKRAVGDISATIRATPASAIYTPVERRAVYGGVRARF